MVDSPGARYSSEKHILYCGRCFSIRQQITGLPPETRAMSLIGPDYDHFVRAMLHGESHYKGVTLSRISLESVR